MALKRLNIKKFALIKPFIGFFYSTRDCYEKVYKLNTF